MEPIKRVMLDLETLGSGPTGVIVAIGAVKITDKIIDTFYRVVDAESGVRAGLKIDVATVMWWLKQSQPAREALCDEPSWDLKLALRCFNEFLGDWQDDKLVEIWGNGANFDNVVLTSSYEAVRMERPWKYFQDRCYRTLRKLHPEIPRPIMAEGEAHNALNDALSQAEHLLMIFGRRHKAFEVIESAIEDFEKLEPVIGETALATAEIYRAELNEIRAEQMMTN